VLVTSLMDGNTTPSQQLAKQLSASTGQNTGSLFSQISENPFFTAVRLIPVVIREAGCAYDCCRALVSRRLVLRRVLVRKDSSMALLSSGDVCLWTSK
jgi:hypothetical protein